MPILALIAGTFLCAVSTYGAGDVVFQELVPSFDRTATCVMVRKITRPTLANLDYAAYTSNPIWYEKQRFRPRPPREKVTLAKITFGGLLDRVCNTLDQTPLTQRETTVPLAWEPLKRHLWDVVKEPGFQSITARINGYKWNDPSIYPAYQQIVAAYLHATGEGTELWVRIEFKPWVKFVAQAVSDEDNDDFPELYGRLSLREIDSEVCARAFQWIQDEYITRVLTRREAVDWATELASYWYPTKNTDLLESGGVWPNGRTERKVKRAVGNLTVRDPIAVLRGRPSGDVNEPIYNIFLVDGLRPEPVEARMQSSTPTRPPTAEKRRDVSVSRNFRENTERFARELRSHGGSYDAWAAATLSYREAQRSILSDMPADASVIVGKDGWLFFRKSLEYSIAGDIADQPRERNPLPHLAELKAFLESREVNLLFVVVPVKSEVYFDKLPTDVGLKDKGDIVNPYGRKILSDLQEAGVEVIDLLPAYLEARTADSLDREPLYQRQDTHWTDRGLRIAAGMIADRVRQYSWYSEAAGSPIEYTLGDTTFSRLGDLVDKLPEQQRIDYQPVVLHAGQVFLPDGRLNRRDKTGSIVLMGDSFTGVYELVDCMGAGVASHLAAGTGLAVDLITSWGGGPLVREVFVRKRGEVLADKRVVVYMMTARDLYGYSQGWAPLGVEK